jgi:hypothetical protein
MPSTYSNLLQSIYTNGTAKREFKKIASQDELTNIIGNHIINSENPESGLVEFLNYCLSEKNNIVQYRVKFAKDIYKFIKLAYNGGSQTKFQKHQTIYTNILDPFLPISCQAY